MRCKLQVHAPSFVYAWMSLAWAGRLRDLRLQKRHELPGTLGKKVIKGQAWRTLNTKKIMNPCPSPTTVGLRNTLAIAFDGEKSIAAIPSVRPAELSTIQVQNHCMALGRSQAGPAVPSCCAVCHRACTSSFCALFTRAHAHFDGGLCIQRLLPALDPIAGNRKLS